MDSRIHIGNVIFGVENSIKGLKGPFRQEARGKLRALQKLVDKGTPVELTVDKAWALLQMVRWETGCLTGEYETEEDFYEAVFGFEIDDAKEDLDFCDEHQSNHKMSAQERNRFNNIYARYVNGSTAAKYLIHELRMEWDDGQ